MNVESASPPQARFSIPPAFHQASQPVEQLLNSSSCGLIIQRTGQIKAKFRSEARQFARELAEYINDRQLGLATVFLYEETFGTKERIHWLIHLRSLDDYPTMVAMGAADERFRELILRERLPGGGRWDEMFLDGTLKETVLVPQRWQNGSPEVPLTCRARAQAALADDQILHSANASSIIQLSGTLRHQHREHGRRLARRLVERLNESQAGAATAFLYDEAFGTGERIHWLIHLRSLGQHAELAGTFGPGAVADPDSPPEDGVENWRAVFVDGSLQEVALTPQYWGMYATKKPA